MVAKNSFLVYKNIAYPEFFAKSITYMSPPQINGNKKPQKLLDAASRCDPGAPLQYPNREMLCSNAGAQLLSRKGKASRTARRCFRTALLEPLQIQLASARALHESELGKARFEPPAVCTGAGNANAGPRVGLINLLSAESGSHPSLSGGYEKTRSRRVFHIWRRGRDGLRGLAACPSRRFGLLRIELASLGSKQLPFDLDRCEPRIDGNR